MKSFAALNAKIANRRVSTGPRSALCEYLIEKETSAGTGARHEHEEST